MGNSKCAVANAAKAPARHALRGRTHTTAAGSAEMPGNVNAPQKRQAVRKARKMG